MIAIIDYGAGNVASVANAVIRLGSSFLITSDINDLNKAEKIIFPGVGEASFAVNKMHAGGLINYLKEITKPCLAYVWACSLCVIILMKEMLTVLVYSLST